MLLENPELIKVCAIFAVIVVTVIVAVVVDNTGLDESIF